MISGAGGPQASPAADDFIANVLEMDVGTHKREAPSSASRRERRESEEEDRSAWTGIGMVATETSCLILRHDPSRPHHLADRGWKVRQRELLNQCGVLADRLSADSNNNSNGDDGNGDGSDEREDAPLPQLPPREQVMRKQVLLVEWKRKLPSWITLALFLAVLVGTIALLAFQVYNTTVAAPEYYPPGMCVVLAQPFPFNINDAVSNMLNIFVTVEVPLTVLCMVGAGAYEIGFVSALKWMKYYISRSKILGLSVLFVAGGKFLIGRYNQGIAYAMLFVGMMMYDFLMLRRREPFTQHIGVSAMMLLGVERVFSYVNSQLDAVTCFDKETTPASSDVYHVVSQQLQDTSQVLFCSVLLALLLRKVSNQRVPFFDLRRYTSLVTTRKASKQHGRDNTRFVYLAQAHGVVIASYDDEADLQRLLSTRGAAPGVAHLVARRLVPRHMITMMLVTMCVFYFPVVSLNVYRVLVSDVRLPNAFISALCLEMNDLDVLTRSDTVFLAIEYSITALAVVVASTLIMTLVYELTLLGFLRYMFYHALRSRVLVVVFMFTVVLRIMSGRFVAAASHLCYLLLLSGLDFVTVIPRGRLNRVLAKFCILMLMVVQVVVYVVSLIESMRCPQVSGAGNGEANQFLDGYQYTLMALTTAGNLLLASKLIRVAYRKYGSYSLPLVEPKRDARMLSEEFEEELTAAVAGLMMPVAVIGPSHHHHHHHHVQSPPHLDRDEDADEDATKQHEQEQQQQAHQQAHQQLEQHEQEDAAEFEFVAVSDESIYESDHEVGIRMESNPLSYQHRSRAAVPILVVTNRHTAEQQPPPCGPLNDDDDDEAHVAMSRYARQQRHIALSLPSYDDTRIPSK